MSRQDKATTERHTKILRELVKKLENKTCADCKHNDPRWASWNLGVFLCIRCSGIHRGMGTHISKVKSIDLDTWTPEQMESIMKWGNRRANLYWEAHLKPGHIPPEHKMESFIRSKYESRRWAMDGPSPSDPSVLENGAAPEPVPEPAPAPIHHPAASHHSTLSTRLPVTTRQPQPHQLLSTQHTRAQSIAIPVPSPAPSAQPVPSRPKGPENDLFSLDFHAPSPSPSSSSTSGPKKDVKQDILSLFSTSAQPQQPQASFGAFAAAPQQAQTQPPWGAPASTGYAPAQAPSPWGSTGVTGFAQQPTSVPNAAGNQAGGNWDIGFGWNTAPTAAAPPAQADIWGAPVSAAQPGLAQQQASLFNTSDVWGGSAGTSVGIGTGGNLLGSSSSVAAGSMAAQKKDDVFGDIWGGFK
ncbi:hypothetical protein EW146_g6236 [Bondarzewia mesenterica]|uniref:Arf-GAP domain-containing protein n=1 Tax=Bondarzewia mesenterica TaxID=1095465 RepID=A0A4S4LPT3_9AGAM|nr:hypothetical protein EW146_g6236 [Bondarzewia mesenterica]